MTMFRKLNFWPLPKAPGGGDTKNCAGACAIHVSNSHTKSGWISGKNFFDPNPPPPHGTPKSHPWAWSRRWNKNPVWYVIYLSFVRRHTKFGLKIFEIDFVIQILMIFYLLAPPQGPRGWWPKEWCRPVHVSFMEVTHTPNLAEFREKIDPQHPMVPPSPTPWAWPRRPNENPIWCFISFMCEKTNTVWLKNLWNWNLMIFDLLTPPKTPGGGAKKMCSCMPH